MTLQTRTVVAPATPQRIRRRVLAVETAPVQPVAKAAPVDEAQVGPAPGIEQMQALLTDYVHANTVKNAAARQEERAKKALHAKMIELGVTVAPSVAVEMEGVTVTADAEIAEKEGEMISVQKLRELVSPEDFMKIVKATKTDVVKVAGSNVCVAATVPSKAPAALHITVAKR